MVLTKSDFKKLKLGAKAPNFNLLGTDEKMHSLESYSGAKALLIIFMCNHCPYVKPKMDKINEIAKQYKSRGLAVVGINSNESENYPEDSFENMQLVSAQHGFVFDYLYDESQQVARAYGAVCTPDPFLFDQGRRLAYHGRIDDKHGEDAARASNEIVKAVEDVLAGNNVSAEQMPSLGCSIKWKA